MNFSNPLTAEEIVINTLATASESGKTLLEKTRLIKPHFTKQALYVILRRLLAREVIVKHGTQYSLSNVWLGKMGDFFRAAQQRYGAQQSGGVDFLNLKDGDKIIYSFKSPEETDRFWAHAFDVLAETMPIHEPIHIYNPHEWFMLARQESERHLFEALREKNRQVWLVAGHRTVLDQYVKQFFDGTYLQYYALEQAPALFEKEYYYCNIFGDFIIEAFLSADTAQAIHKFYLSTEEWNDVARERLHVVIRSGKTKLTISRNIRKAKKLKKVIGEHFYLVQSRI